MKSVKLGDLLELEFLFRRPTAVGFACLQALLESNGFRREEIVETNSAIKIFLPPTRASEKKVAQLKAAALRRIRFRCKRLAARDWQERWKEGVRPFLLTPEIMVVPRWSQKKVDPKGKKVILLDNTLAFGTGLHETTRYMSRLIASQQGQFVSFMDIGTGTGILSVVAYHCGARKIKALDIDPLSIDVARKNFKLNRVRSAQVFLRDFSKYRVREKFDFVAANILTEDLISMQRKLLASVRAGGFLAVSGISLKKLSRLQKTFKSCPLRCLKILRGRKWAAILYQRKGGNHVAD